MLMSLAASCSCGKQYDKLIIEIQNQNPAVNQSTESLTQLIIYFMPNLVFRLPYNLYCVGVDVKHCSLTHSLYGGTAAAAPPPFRPGSPALCGSCPLVTPWYCMPVLTMLAGHGLWNFLFAKICIFYSVVLWSVQPLSATQFRCRCVFNWCLHMYWPVSVQCMRVCVQIWVLIMNLSRAMMLRHHLQPLNSLPSCQQSTAFTLLTSSSSLAIISYIPELCIGCINSVIAIQTVIICD